MNPFVKQFLLHPRAVSTPCEIRPSLAKPMARSVEGKVVAEFGSGRGAITKYVLRYLPSEGRLYCFEVIPEFCDELRKITEGDNRVRVINAPAQNMYDYMETPPDSIVCSIPLQTIRRKIRRQILEVAKTAVAEKSGLFMPMQYYLPFFGDRPPRLKRVLDRYFSEVQWNPICGYLPPRGHFPPAGYYLCRNKRG